VLDVGMDSNANATVLLQMRCKARAHHTVSLIWRHWCEESGRCGNVVVDAVSRRCKRRGSLLLLRRSLDTWRLDVFEGVRIACALLGVA